MSPGPRPSCRFCCRVHASFPAFTSEQTGNVSISLRLGKAGEAQRFSVLCTPLWTLRGVSALVLRAHSHVDQCNTDYCSAPATCQALFSVLELAHNKTKLSNKNSCPQEADRPRTTNQVSTKPDGERQSGVRGQGGWGGQERCSRR